MTLAADPALPVPMADLWRGDFLESRHLGQAVLCDDTGAVVRAWGDPDAVVLPRSSVKMIQALPLLASGAADAAGLGTEHLALSCASHNGAAIHTERVTRWLSDLGLGEDDLRCGPQMPADRDAREALIRAEGAPCQHHNNCSGKHAGFLTLNRHLGGDAEYVDPAHPVQRAVLETFETVTGETSPGYGIDGCSAPNFAASLAGIARAMAWFASAADRADRLSQGGARLTQAMCTHPELVAGEGRACTGLMRAMEGRVAVKTGAEGVFVAIIPELRQGLALKIADGATRAAELAVAAILVDLGVLDPAHPEVTERLDAPILNRRNIETGRIRRAPAFP